MRDPQSKMSYNHKLVNFIKSSLPCPNKESTAPFYVGHQVQPQLIITGFQLANFPQVGAQVLASAPSQTSRTIVAPTKYHSSPLHLLSSLHSMETQDAANQAQNLT